MKARSPAAPAHQRHPSRCALEAAAATTLSDSIVATVARSPPADRRPPTASATSPRPEQGDAEPDGDGEPCPPSPSMLARIATYRRLSVESTISIVSGHRPAVVARTVSTVVDSPAPALADHHHRAPPRELRQVAMRLIRRSRRDAVRRLRPAGRRRMQGARPRDRASAHLDDRAERDLGMQPGGRRAVVRSAPMKWPAGTRASSTTNLPAMRGGRTRVRSGSSLAAVWLLGSTRVPSSAPSRSAAGSDAEFPAARRIPSREARHANHVPQSALFIAASATKSGVRSPTRSR